MGYCDMSWNAPCLGCTKKVRALMRLWVSSVSGPCLSVPYTAGTEKKVSIFNTISFPHLCRRKIGGGEMGRFFFWVAWKMGICE